jgi:4-amino-4-deoxy-L-arabinose transferase-like glycosyltransferase
LTERRRWIGPLRAAVGQVPDRWLLVGLFVFAFVIRLAYLLEIKDTDFFSVLVGDSAVYDAWAQQIQRDWVGREVFYQAPLYPYFLATIYSVFGHALFAARLVQITLGAGACVLLAGAGRAFLSRGAGLLAGLFLAVYAPAMFFEGLIQKSSLDLFLMTGLLFCLGRCEVDPRRRWSFLGGVALGCLALTRENAMILLPVLALWMGWRFRKRRAVLLVLGTVLVLTPVAIRNYAVGGEVFVTTAQFGANFYLGNNAQADGKYTPLRWGHGNFAEERADAIDIAEKAAGRALTMGQVSRYWSGLAWDWIHGHPLEWLRLMGRKWLLVWNQREIPDSDEPAVYKDASLILTGADVLFSFGIVCPLAAAGMVALWSRRRRVGVLYLVVGSIAVSASLFVVYARYRFPMVPGLLLFAAAGLLRIAALVKDRSAGRVAVAYVALVAVAAIAVRIPFESDEKPRAMAHYNLAVSLEAQGELPRAAASYRKALESDPRFAQAHVNLGSILARGGELEEAIGHERTALELHPDDPVAHTIWANALLELGRLDDAELHYRAALKIQPDLPQARDGLAALQELREKATR